jgi:predicted DsbA family dithiol-disulfide isomerase
MEKFLTSMSALGRDEGIAFDFQSGVIANSLHALRILFVLQNEFSPDKAFLALESLYEQYFERGKHPASSETLMMACDAAGLSTEEVRAIVQNEEKGRKEVQREIENQRGMGDSVPCVVFEGRKRNFREVGAKSVGEYGRILEQIEKEAV